MDKSKPPFSVGYKKPPEHTRFKSGQSGNPGGRPKKKSRTFAESMERELNTKVTANEGGKSRRITKLDAIVKLQTNRAIQGDHKATSLVLKALEPRESDRTDNLSPVLQAMRAIHTKHEIANENGIRATDVSRQSHTALNDSERGDNDPA